MKKLFTIVLGLGLVGFASAQNTKYSASLPSIVNGTNKAAGDTVVVPTPGGSACAADSVFFSPVIGTASTQGTAILGVAQRYNPVYSSQVIAILAYYVVSGTATSAANFPVTLNAAGTAPGAIVGGSPDFIGGSSVGLLGTDTIYRGVWGYQTPVSVPTDFYVTLSTASAVPTDSIMWGFKNCEGSLTYGNLGGTWMNLAQFFKNDLMIQVIAIEGTSSAGINEQSIVSAGIMPNPANDFTSLVYNVSEAAKVDLKIINVAGQVVKQISEGSKQPGTYVTNIDVTDLAAGTYVYQVNANGQSFTGRLVVAK